MPVDKVIVTNVTVLREKYGARYSAVRLALTALIDADLKRGLTTRLIAIDSPTDMAKVKGKAVTKPSNPQQVKAAIDAIYTAHNPDYIMILGAPDVVPHILLPNPAHDDDELVPTDLPYACPHPFSRNSRDFLGPTRVVGRLPDVFGATDRPIWSRCSARRLDTRAATARATLSTWV